MTALAKVDQPQAGQVVPITDSAAMLSVISRAASDPNVDIDKMERLLQMHDRMQDKQAAVEFAAALAEMQDALPAIEERGKAKVGGQVRYTFAKWEDINVVIKPVLKQFGFALSFRTDFTDGIAITGVLTHKAGHREETTMKLPADSSGSKNDVQAVASSVSYGKRYTAGALLNLTSHGEDDDAFAAAIPDKDRGWIAKVTALTDYPEYLAMKKEMLADYGHADNIPRKVRDTFNAVAAATKP